MKKKIFLPSILLGLSVRVYGFNPVAAMAATQAIENAADTADATIDLAQEAMVDEDLIREAEANVKRLEKLNANIRDTHGMSQELKSFSDFDLSRSKTLAGKLRQVVSKTRQGKRLFSLFGGKSQNSAIQVENVKLNYRILDELRNIRLTEFSRHIEEQESRVKFQLAVERILKEEEVQRRKTWSIIRAKGQQR